jgi:hypothetical protein
MLFRTQENTENLMADLSHWNRNLWFQRRTRGDAFFERMRIFGQDRTTVPVSGAFHAGSNNADCGPL